MSGFTFGTQGTTVSATSNTGSLFGTVSKPLFGTSATTVQTTGIYFVPELLHFDILIQTKFEI